MAFGTISVFYTSGSAGGYIAAGVGGNRIAALRSTQDTTESGSTQTTHTANATTRRVVSPYQSSANAGPDSTRGFAIDPADMGSVAGALRFFPAGNHVFTFYATGGNALGSNTYFLRAYRVGPSPSFTKTLIATEASATGSGLGASVSVSLPLPQIIFQPGETIMYEPDVQTNPGITAGTVTISLGTSSALTGSVVARITTPELGILASARASAAGAGDATARGSIVLPARAAASGLGVASARPSVTAGARATASGNGIALGRPSAVAGAVASAAGSSQVLGRITRIVGAVGTVNIGAGGSAVIRRKRVLIIDKA